MLRPDLYFPTNAEPSGDHPAVTVVHKPTVTVETLDGGCLLYRLGTGDCGLAVPPSGGSKSQFDRSVKLPSGVDHTGIGQHVHCQRTVEGTRQRRRRRLDGPRGPGRKSNIKPKRGPASPPFDIPPQAVARPSDR